MEFTSLFSQKEVTTCFYKEYVGGSHEVKTAVIAAFGADISKYVL